MSAAGRALAARALALDSTAVGAIEILKTAGVDALLLKGPVTATRLYADAPDARDYCDVDLLVAPSNYEVAQAALAAQGYRNPSEGVRTSEIDDREVTWLTPGASPLAIDLHRSLSWVGDPATLWAALWRGRTTLDLQGTSIAVPSMAGTALIVALHASRPGRTTKPMLDLARAVAVFSDDDWHQAIELARTGNALAGVARGLETVPDARPLIARLGLSTDVPTPMRLAGYGTSPAGLAIGHVLGARGLLGKLGHVLARVFPSVAFMHKAWPQSRRGRLPLAHAHLQRWLRLVRSLPSGLRELQDARHGAVGGRDAWASDQLAAVRRQLATTGLRRTEDTSEPPDALTAGRVNRVLDQQRASCLERALVRQRFHAAHGSNRELVIGVSRPGEHFHAHAWLAGDVGQDEGLAELLRRRSDHSGDAASAGRHRSTQQDAAP